MPPLSSDPKALPSLTISPDVLEALQTQQAPTPSPHLPLLHVLTLGMVSRPRIWVSFGTPLLASTRHRSLDGSNSLPLLYAYDCPLLQVHIFHQYHSHGSSLLPRLPHLQIPAPTASSQLSHQNMLKTLTVTTVPLLKTTTSSSQAFVCAIPSAGNSSSHRLLDHLLQEN